MAGRSGKPENPAISRLAALRQWGTMLGLSAGLAGLFNILELPAALMLGPMIAGAVIACRTEVIIGVPRPASRIADCVIGCLIARSLPLSAFTGIGDGWPSIVIGVGMVMVITGALGWLLMRMRVLPGTTVVWGLSPGGASVMVVMAEAMGADAQLVAFMQYIRVFFVAMPASIFARLADSHVAAALHPAFWIGHINATAFAQTAGLIAASILLARLLRVPSGRMLIPMIAGILLTHYGVMAIELPQPLLAFAYAIIGWRIGLHFTRPLLSHALRVLPAIIGITLALITACGVLAAGFVVFAGVDLLTAYLATSPGGADVVAIIASSAKVDVPFVMAMQTARLLVVMLVGPLMARAIANRLRGG